MTPKQLFQTNLKQKANHAKLVENVETETFLTAAFSEYAYTLAGNPTPQASWDAHNRLLGARAFMAVFLSLSKTPPEPKLDPSALQPEP